MAENAHYRTYVFGGAIGRNRSVFACALVFSPVRMAGQTACPEESLARARKRCEGGDWKLEIGDWRLANCKPVDPANAAAAEGGEGN